MRSVQERITAEVTSHIRSSLDLETMVRTAAREVRQSLGLPKVLVQLLPPANSNGSSNGKNGHSKQDEPDDNPDTGIPS
jgi:GAF domain-containing protein